MAALATLVAAFADHLRQIPPGYELIVTMGSAATANTLVVTLDAEAKTATLAFTAV